MALNSLFFKFVSSNDGDSFKRFKEKIINQFSIYFIQNTCCCENIKNNNLRSILGEFSALVWAAARSALYFSVACCISILSVDISSSALTFSVTRSTFSSLSFCSSPRTYKQSTINFINLNLIWIKKWFKYKRQKNMISNDSKWSKILRKITII